MSKHEADQSTLLKREADEVNGKDKSKALERLKKALEAIPDLQQEDSSSPRFEKWCRDTEVAIEHTFGAKSRHIDDFNGIHYFPQVLFSGMAESTYQKKFASGLQSAASVLQSMIDEINEYWQDDLLDEEPQISEALPPGGSLNVFVIHGHEDGTKETVARFLTILGLKPIILHEKPNEGRTIIEKFENFADVAYAVALFTPDDVGGKKTEPEKLQDRARQNVIFEFGYFMGHLGRNRVCGLTVGDIELPSDYAGVIYIPIDAEGAWRMKLVKELKAVGIEVDANKAL
jgi:predicted nucleotide-binding protein